MIIFFYLCTYNQIFYIADATKEDNKSDFVFGRENLSDCGLSPSILESMCRIDKDAIKIIERLTYNKDLGGFTYD